MQKIKMSTVISPCEKCGNDRFKTIHKGKKYECRWCHTVRVIKEKKSRAPRKPKV
jgi:hypothetical protein